ncbi:MAG: hypothetical protein WCY19_05090 [Candidatus Gastranaerophilaceae bacterium]
MNLKELKKRIDATYKFCRNPEEVNVCITISEPSMGGRAKCNVKGVGRGIDWERNDFRIEPEIILTRKNNEKGE